MNRFIKRAEWGARPAKRVVNGRLTDKSTGHWNGPKITVKGMPTWGHAYCFGLVRGIQNFHMDGKSWSDIAYNFVECPHGYTFEGRGLNVINGANGTNEGNRTSHAIMCLAGEENPFPEDEKLGFRECVMYVANSTGALEGAKGHRDHKSTACPGDARYSWIRQGMPIKEVVVAPPIDPIDENEEDLMNEPLEIVKTPTEGPWYATDGLKKQWLQNREHAAILVFNRGAKTEVKPASLKAADLAKMVPYVWPQSVVDDLILVGPPPPEQ